MPMADGLCGENGSSRRRGHQLTARDVGTPPALIVHLVFRKPFRDDLVGRIIGHRGRFRAPRRTIVLLGLHAMCQE